jgi:hypothetical protein
VSCEADPATIDGTGHVEEVQGSCSCWHLLFLGLAIRKRGE